MLVLAGLSGCSGIEPWVKPYERDKLADPIMALDGDPVSTAYIQHVFEAGKVRAVAKELPAAAAAVTRRLGLMIRRVSLVATALSVFGAAEAGVLPDDRADVLYHRYDGGGVTIDGPSVLVRKKAGKSLSFVGNYYVDMISSASIDVITTASPYTEERTQWSMGMDYLRGNTTMRVNYTTQ